MIADLASALEESRFGGKASQLARALAAGLPVPGGIAIACDGSQTARTLAHEVLLRMDIGAGAAVRSSGIGEDGAEASFAGQHATRLGVTCVDSLADAIEEVRASVRTESALAYRKKLGLTDTPKMGIVVQSLVHADVAGVLFSRHPITGADERVIEASYGLGEIVVAGLVTPDSFRVARGGAVLERRAGEKDVMIVHAGAGTEERRVPEHLVDALCLSDQDLAALDALTTRCEAIYGESRDLEWAIEKGALFLLQCRAITRVGT